VAKHSQSPDHFNVLLNTLVIEIRQNESDLDQPVEVVTQNTVTGERRTFKARKVISSLPVNQYEKVKFVPELPFVKRNVFKFYQPGNYMKYVVTYRRAFWREKGFSGQGTFDGSVKWVTEETFNASISKNHSRMHIKMPKMGASAECWDGSDENGEPALVGFIAAQSAVEWADQDESLREKEVIEGLCRLFGDEARDYVKYVDKQWSKKYF
jgi:monoamine oxidase